MALSWVSRMRNTRDHSCPREETLFPSCCEKVWFHANLPTPSKLASGIGTLLSQIGTQKRRRFVMWIHDGLRVERVEYWHVKASRLRWSLKLLENTKLDLNLNSRWVEWLTGMSRWYLENGFWKTVHRLGSTLVLLIRPLKDTCPDSAQGDWLVLGVVSMPNVTGSDELWKKGKWLT